MPGVAETHYERSTRIIGEGTIREARELANRYGPQASMAASRIGRERGLEKWPLARLSGAANNEFVKLRAESLPDPYDIDALFSDPAMDRWFRETARKFTVVIEEGGREISAGEMPEDVAEAQVRMASVQAWVVGRYEACGKRTYEVSPGLADRLAHTQLRGLTTDDLVLPFKALYIVVPEEACLSVWNDETGEHRIDGVYIVEGWMYREGARIRTWWFMACGMPIGGDPLDDALYYFPVPLPDGLALDEAVRQEAARVRDIVARSVVAELAEVDRRMHLSGRWEAIFRWAMNAMIYATWPDARRELYWANQDAAALRDRLAKLPKGGKRDDLKERLRALPARERVRLGHGLPPWSTEERAAARGTGQPLATRTLVPGHWQRYHVGKGRAEVVRKLKEPFWRGPADAPISNPRRVL